MGNGRWSKKGANHARTDHERENEPDAGFLRIFMTASPKAKRVEFRPPDPSCNPYLPFTAMLMAGLDGVENKTDRASRSTTTSRILDRKSWRTCRQCRARWRRRATDHNTV
ncbi:MAG: hypothetical protein ACJ72H_25315 [Candidatus Sulfotelmatobacter sp.]